MGACFDDDNSYADAYDILSCSYVVLVYSDTDFASIFRRARQEKNEVLFLYFLSFAPCDNLRSFLADIHTFSLIAKQKR